MTAKTRSANKAVFETGDTPDGSDYASLIDSYFSILDTTSQSVVSDVVLGGTLYLEGYPVVADVTVAVSTSTSATMFAKVVVSGVEYGVKLFKI